MKGPNQRSATIWCPPPMMPRSLHRPHVMALPIPTSVLECFARSPVKDTPKPKRPGATIGSLHPQLPVQQSYDPHLQRRKPYEYATELSTLSQCGPQEPEILSSSHYTHGEASAGWREVQSRGANIATLTDMVLVLGRVQRFLSSAIEPKYRT